MKNKKAPVKKALPEVMQKKIDSIYKDKQVGRKQYKPLIHKDGSIYDDVDYFELLGRRAIELEEEQKRINPNIPVNFKEKGFDNDCVKVAKVVVEAIDKKQPKNEIKAYIQACIDYENII